MHHYWPRRSWKATRLRDNVHLRVSTLVCVFVIRIRERAHVNRTSAPLLVSRETGTRRKRMQASQPANRSLLERARVCNHSRVANRVRAAPSLVAVAVGTPPAFSVARWPAPRWRSERTNIPLFRRSLVRTPHLPSAAHCVPLYGAILEDQWSCGAQGWIK